MSTQPIPQPDNFQYIKLPDGSYGKFAADASDDVIKAAISKDFPGAFKAPAPQDNRTGLQRFLDSAGIPRHIGTMADVGQAAKNLLAPQASPTDPGFGQTLPVVGPIFRAQRETYDQSGVAAKVYGSLPLVGPPGYRAGQQLESGDYAGAAGSALNILTQMLGMKPTNLTRNIGNATQEAGNLAVKAAPKVGNAAKAGAFAGALVDAAHSGRYYDPILTAIFHKRIGNAAESATSSVGSFLQRAGSSINPETPAQFGNPAFSSASIQTPAQANREAFINSLRTRLALPPGPTELGPSSIDATQTPEGLLPAARQVVKDTNTGQLRDQYTTSVASPNQSPYSIVGAKNLKAPTAIDDLQGYKMNSAIEQVRDLMSRQDGVGAAEADARMAEYAKKPWENEKTSVTVPEKITVGSKAGADQDTALFNQARKVLGPNASDSQVIQFAQKLKTAVVTPGNGIPADAAVPQEAAAYMPEVVNNSSDLLGLLQKSLAAASTRRK